MRHGPKAPYRLFGIFQPDQIHLYFYDIQWAEILRFVINGWTQMLLVSIIPGARVHTEITRNIRRIYNLSLIDTVHDMLSVPHCVLYSSSPLSPLFNEHGFLLRKWISVHLLTECCRSYFFIEQRNRIFDETALKGLSFGYTSHCRFRKMCSDAYIRN